MIKDKLGLSYLYGDNAYYIEELYEQYLNNPKSINEYWSKYFDELNTLPGNVAKDLPRFPIEKSISEYTRSHTKNILNSSYINSDYLKKHTDVLRLISAYRILGSRKANLDPLKRFGTMYIPELDPKNRGISENDMSQTFSDIGTNFVHDKPMSLSEIINKLEQTYCGNIGVEFMHIIASKERNWVKERLEKDLSYPSFNNEQKINILKKLTAAETLERYLHTKYVGQKRFSLEGGESLIPCLDHLINQSTKSGIEEIVIGMAHRGRLNILVNTLGKLPNDLFAEFEGKQKIELESGDVKYHNGFSSDLATNNGPIHISLEFNPSHLEIVNPVVEGNVRTRQRKRGENGKDKVLPILIHGDAAIIGLGVNQANFNLSQTRGFTTGGTVHIVVNNQIGFTTSDVRDVRSTTYCTDIAKMIDAPIFHVNGDDPERVCYVIQLALEFRMNFKKDALVDIVCYRRLGHNEGDDPFITQPMMYKKILTHDTTRKIYAEKLTKEGILKTEQTEDLIKQYKLALDKGDHIEQTTLVNYKKINDWEKYKKTLWTDFVDTSITKKDIKQLTNAVTKVPEEFNLHRTVKKLLENRIQMGNGEIPIDWGMAETLAYASLLVRGNAIRISGEDSGRGTFSHRHAVLHDQNRERWDKGVYLPLQNISDTQASFMIIDSILNEEAVLAYEYGFSCSSPEHLVIWEAQFGDFANGAQVPIDQFITSGETKWGRLSGLTLILPHGFDGQGPEHSSARLERWLQLSAENNIQIVNMTESAQMFHVLRRQILRPYRKPLIIFMSKRLLRYKDSTSDISCFTNGSVFKNIIGEKVTNNKKITKIILCSGQIYFDLKNKRKLINKTDEVAIIRIEQLYPFPYDDLTKELKKYTNVKKFVWCQEEPKNQGAWFQIRDKLEKVLGLATIKFAGRPKSATTAVGYKKKHDEQLSNLLDDAFN